MSHAVSLSFEFTIARNSIRYHSVASRGDAGQRRSDGDIIVERRVADVQVQKLRKHAASHCREYRKHRDADGSTRGNVTS